MVDFKLSKTIDVDPLARDDKAIEFLLWMMQFNMTSDFSVAVAGSVSAAFSTVSVYPLDTIKTYMNKGSDESGKPIRTPGDVLFKVILRHGWSLGAIRALYSGIESKVVMSMTQKFLYFYVYNYLIRIVKKSKGSVSVVLNLVVGYISAMIAVGILTPFEIGQTRLQLNPAEKRSVVEIMRTIYNTEGIMGLYRGFQTNIILCINPAIDYSVFDQSRKKILSRSGKRSLSDWEAFWLGAFSKAVATVLTFPHVRAKVLQQAGVYRFRNMESSSILVSLLVTDGFTSWFAGMKTQLLKNVLAAAIMMSSKERIEQLIVRKISNR